MTETATATSPTTKNTAWNDQFAALKARYPHVRDAILVALHIISQDPDIAIDDAKAQAQVHGVRITAASINAARRLLSRQDSAPANAPKAKGATAPIAKSPTRRARPAPTASVDAEALIRQVADKIRAEGSLEAQRLRDAMRRAITMLEAAVG